MLTVPTPDLTEFADTNTDVTVESALTDDLPDCDTAHTAITKKCRLLVVLLTVPTLLPIVPTSDSTDWLHCRLVARTYRQCQLPTL